MKAYSILLYGRNYGRESFIVIDISAEKAVRKAVAFLSKRSKVPPQNIECEKLQLLDGQVIR